ncbi:hypothetical protein [Qipengyuania sp. 902]|uniref:hypothetical protein n=1 Tax=Qipengyuania sp. 902 TaxID=3417565 RepID=UPI003EB84FB9
MSRIDHDRPELRLKDNFRREIEKVRENVASDSSAAKWPKSLKPVAENPKTLAALGDFFSNLDAWSAGDYGAFNFSEPPSVLKKSLEHLLRQRIVSISDGLTVEDWLREPNVDQSGTLELRPLLIIFVDLWL